MNEHILIPNYADDKNGTSTPNPSISTFMSIFINIHPNLFDFVAWQSKLHCYHIEVKTLLGFETCGWNGKLNFKVLKQGYIKCIGWNSKKHLVTKYFLYHVWSAVLVILGFLSEINIKKWKSNIYISKLVHVTTLLL